MDAQATLETIAEYLDQRQFLIDSGWTKDEARPELAPYVERFQASLGPS